MGQALSSVPQHDAMSTRQHVGLSLPEDVAMSTQQHVNFPKHATQLTKTTVPVVGTVSHRIDPEQTELEEDSIPRPATYISQKQSFKKIKLRCDSYEMHHPHVRHRRTTILLRKMREQIPWANWLKLEKA